MSNPHIHIRRMTSEDVATGMELVRAAGWNQTDADWKRFLEANAGGCFVAECEGEVCGTVASIIYGNEIAWIGMVLVSPRQRGKGIGTGLLKFALDHLDSRGPLTIKLDATPQGKPIYARLGFTPEYEIERWARMPTRSGMLQKPLTSPALRFRERSAEGRVRVLVDGMPGNVSSQIVENILALDRKVFEEDRSGLLRSLHRDASEFTSAIWNEGTLAGYALGRHGLNADHLGPWVAQDKDTAGKLLEEFLNHSTRQRLIVDCVQSNPFARELLRSAGFEFSRPLTRMVRGTNRSRGPGELLYAVLGPEFG